MKKQNMLYIQWTDAYQTNCMILDEQHHGIIAAINSLYYFIQKGYGLDALRPTLKILNEYILFHLKTEEMILHDSGFDLNKEQISAQKEEHNDFQLIARQAIRYKDPNMMLNFLKKWWLNHIKSHDKHLHHDS